MPDNTKIAVVIPSYKTAAHIKDVILAIPDNVDHIIVVDDKCPESSGKAAEATGRKNLIVLYHERNQGVGGAMMTGYKKALELNCDIAVKIDGDGQMDASYMQNLITPLKENEADYTKGNRFRDFTALKFMPWIRFFGNSILSFLLKMSSGYWNIMDPTNGYTAIHRRALEKLDPDKISKGYFFESDMLIHLNMVNAVVKDISIPAKYGKENSSLKIKKIIFIFPQKIIKGLFLRLAFKYFIYDFNMASVYLLIGLPTFMFGVIFGAVEWLRSIGSSVARPLGTIMLAVLPIILGAQLLLQAISIDINSIPKKEK
ncbi:MAG: glycosyltransferase family 2 protein [Nitrospirae bacterium]|nr:MAG: glycosyltransferase family 2 protein [Nitrospirota bacterium]